MCVGVTKLYTKLKGPSSRKTFLMKIYCDFIWKLIFPDCVESSGLPKRTRSLPYYMVRKHGDRRNWWSNFVFTQDPEYPLAQRSFKWKTMGKRHIKAVYIEESIYRRYQPSRPGVESYGVQNRDLKIQDATAVGRGRKQIFKEETCCACSSFLLASLAQRRKWSRRRCHFTSFVHLKEIWK